MKKEGQKVMLKEIVKKIYILDKRILNLITNSDEFTVDDKIVGDSNEFRTLCWISSQWLRDCAYVLLSVPYHSLLRATARF